MFILILWAGGVNVHALFGLERLVAVVTVSSSEMTGEESRRMQFFLSLFLVLDIFFGDGVGMLSGIHPSIHL